MWLAKIEFTLFASRGGQTFAVDGDGEKEVCVCFGDVRAMSRDRQGPPAPSPYHGVSVAQAISSFFGGGENANLLGRPDDDECVRAGRASGDTARRKRDAESGSDTDREGRNREKGRIAAARRERKLWVGDARKVITST